MMTSYSPWGKYSSSDTHSHARGITSVSTASHGGFKLSKGRIVEMAKKGLPAKIWYEEDCEYALVVIAFPQYFDEAMVNNAKEVAKDWYPDEYMKFANVTLTINDSKRLRQRDFDKRNENNWVVISAMGSWHEHCPDGMTLCCATIGGRRSHDAKQKYFLVPKDEYNNCTFSSFVIQSNHKEYFLLDT